MKTQLTPFTRENNIEVWDDTQISPGSDWKEETRKALAAAKIAILLVSPDFIDKEELPSLLQASKKEGLTVFWIPIRHSSYKLTKINEYQPAHNPAHPLSDLSDTERDKALVDICEKLQKAFES